MLRLVLRFAGNVAALWIAARLIDGVSYGGDAGTLALAALVLTVANWTVRPIVTFLAIPLIILTLGVALLFVSLAMLELTAWLVHGFRIDGFGAAVATTILVWLVNLVASAVAHDTRRSRRRSRGRDGRRPDGRRAGRRDARG
jgi:putative membrane protein